MASTVLNKIQWRPGQRFSERLIERAEAWNVTPHEASRRLCQLADEGLTLRHYDNVIALMNTLPGGFACAVAYFAKGQNCE